jgi:hypothetical protein
MCAIESCRFTGAPYRNHLYQKASPRKATTEKATTRSLLPSRRRHFDLERHVGTRYEATDL